MQTLKHFKTIRQYLILSVVCVMRADTRYLQSIFEFNLTMHFFTYLCSIYLHFINRFCCILSFIESQCILSIVRSAN